MSQKRHLELRGCSRRRAPEAAAFFQLGAILDSGLTSGSLVLLFFCLAAAFGFEFVNGFHDTANAVATVIYTNSLPPKIAVAFSGVCNFLGVFLGGTAVAMGIIKLLPVELVVANGTGSGLAMVLSLLLAAIAWNLGTWYLGLPSSSSHTLIGSILGVGLANSVLSGGAFGQGVNWSKAEEIGISLLISPMIGFFAAALLLAAVKRYTRMPSLLQPPPKNMPPPRGTRSLLILTCSGVSFAHGSNDGQKGVGIVMLILIGLVPAGFAVNPEGSQEQIAQVLNATKTVRTIVRDHRDQAAAAEADRVIVELDKFSSLLEGRSSCASIPNPDRFPIRQSVLVADRSIEKMIASGGLGLSHEDAEQLTAARKIMRSLTDYAPTWVLIAIALALGVGTMVGWKRIVITVGERIGKSHLTYGQGAVAEIVAFTTIGASAWLGVPVSTTHVLSSGVAGTMVAQGSGVQLGTVRNIALAWVLTLPASVILSATMFWLLRHLIG
jgi:PiT family inorganic phosphate transporter